MNVLPKLPSDSSATRGPGGREFIGMMSMTMAVTAISIDIMLPAFGSMRREFGLPSNSSAVAATVTAFFLGHAVAQLFYGPLADRFGRKPILYSGFIIYVVAAIGSALSPTLAVLLTMRVLWGIGAAGPRVVALAVVRDRYSGQEMARAMSLIMAIFLLVPVVAPSLGAGIITWGSWRLVFWACATFAVLVALWTLRLPETLSPEDSRALEWSQTRDALRTVLGNRATLGHTLAMTFVFGPFLSYLASSEVIISDVFDRSSQFPFIFGGLAAVMGGAMLGNARLVRRIGIPPLVRRAALAYVTVAAGLTGLTVLTGADTPFWVFVTGLAGMLVAHALLIPNLNALAMEPMGSVAGTASALIGTVSTLGGALLGTSIDRLYNGTPAPLATGFLVCGLASLTLMSWADDAVRPRLLRQRRYPSAPS